MAHDLWSKLSGRAGVRRDVRKDSSRCQCRTGRIRHFAKCKQTALRELLDLDDQTDDLPGKTGNARWRKIGGPGRDRTDDLFHAMEARSQLRHRPTLRKDSFSILTQVYRLVNRHRHLSKNSRSLPDRLSCENSENRYSESKRKSQT